MVCDSDPNVEKHAFYTLKVGSQTVFFSLTPLEKVWGQLTPSTLCFRGLLYGHRHCQQSTEDRHAGTWTSPPRPKHFSLAAATTY